MPLGTPWNATRGTKRSSSSRVRIAGNLSGPDLESLAETAWFTAHADIGTDAKERAFKAYLAEGDTIRAAYFALDLTQSYAYRGKPSIASAWVRRGERLLEGQPESYAHGYFALCRSEGAKEAGDVEPRSHWRRMRCRSGRTGDADLQATR